jgi:hypothetical protein
MIHFYSLIGGILQTSFPVNIAGGVSMAFSGDGTTLAIGYGNNNQQNCVIVYSNISGVWAQLDAIKIDTEPYNPLLSVDLNADGNKLIVGFPYSGNGVVRVYDRKVAGYVESSGFIDGKFTYPNIVVSQEEKDIQKIFGNVSSDVLSKLVVIYTEMTKSKYIQLPYNLTYLETPQYHMRCKIGDIKYYEVANTMYMSYDGIRSFVDWADFKYVNGELLLEFDERMFLGNNVIFTNTTKKLSFLYTKNAEEQQAYDFLTQTNVVIRIGNLMLSLVRISDKFTYRIDNVFIVQNDTPVMPPGLIGEGGKINSKMM